LGPGQPIADPEPVGMYIQGSHDPTKCTKNLITNIIIHSTLTFLFTKYLIKS
jgi:hypothetical protein